MTPFLFLMKLAINSYINHILTAILLFCFPLPAQTELFQVEACPLEMAKQALEDVLSLKQDWESVYHSYKRFSRCDDGAISQGYSDAIIRLLEYKWDQLEELLKLLANDKDFEDFVVRHASSEAVTAKDSEVIMQNLRKRCPGEGKRLCQAIIRAGH